MNNKPFRALRAAALLLLLPLCGAAAGCGNGFDSKSKEQQTQSFQGHQPSGASMERYQQAMQAAAQGSSQRGAQGQTSAPRR